ncbi:hypothetical protein [endosymbiont GvMRE of Glomus versiforme]|uniref:hypothetical protein n=1 Tax=endosymbiont GvMRE of Glomus versiforme TaxID=2039283 RepID=UPI000EC06639|nr:hypothetical protein [endosymbiont GvMRE of Glomus versiforme]RHZ36115.1 hypothetical protein GvMRE_Ic2g48 [endosymbiont GvMRE of Glomus versiforme]
MNEPKNKEIIIRGFEELYDVIFTTDDFKHIKLEWRDSDKYIEAPIEAMDSDINMTFNDVIETKYFMTSNREIRIWVHTQESVKTNETYDRVFLWCGYDQTAYKGFLNKKKDGSGWVSYLKVKPQMSSSQQ